MSKQSVTEYLIRTVLDEGFRLAAIADPDRAFDGFDLSEDEKETLRSGDDRLLALLGGAVAQNECATDRAVDDAASGSSEATPSGLPTVELLLRLQPQVSHTAESGVRVAYAASLHSWPEPESTPGVDSKDEQQKDAALAELTWLVRITPTILESGDAGSHVAYSASVLPIDLQTGVTSPVSQASSAGTVRSPWGHHVESQAAKDAAQAVRACEPGQRYDRLLDLVGALQTGDHRG